MAMIPPHVFMVHFGEENQHINGNVYSYLVEKSEVNRLMGVEMAPIRRNNGRNDELAHWLDQITKYPPPTHSPTMFANNNSKSVVWPNCYEAWGSQYAHNFNFPFLENVHRDDSSEDSYNSAPGNHAKQNKFPRRYDSGGGGDFREYKGTLFRFQSPSYPRYSDMDYDKRYFHGPGTQRGRQRIFTPQSRSSSVTRNYIPPDRFLSHAHLVHVSESPPQLAGSDQLSKNIWDKFISKQQTTQTYRQKILLWKDLFLFIRSSFPKFGLFLVGSTMSGLGSDSSDVDMCLLVRCSDMDQRNEALLHLGHVAHYLRQSTFVSHVDLIYAKVPILKLKSKGMEIDLNCNNAVGIRNTHLLYCYARVDWRVRPLVLVVKLWAARHNINDAKRMTVSSYSWALMVIHYLQCGVEPAVVPCLQKTFRDKFLPYSDINHIYLHEELPAIPSENTDSLAKLLLGFLHYYAEFDYNQYAVSVRLAAKIPIEECRRTRSIKNEPHQWKYLCIEEPFDLTNTARSVYDFGAFERVRRVVQVSFQRLNNTHKLESLFEASFNPI